MKNTRNKHQLIVLIRILVINIQQYAGIEKFGNGFLFKHGG